MATLYHLAKRTEPGDSIRWIGVESEIENPQPRTVQRVILELGRVTVEAEGPKGGFAKFWVDEDGNSRALFGEDEQDMGPVDKAELPDKDLRTAPFPE